MFCASSPLKSSNNNNSTNSINSNSRSSSPISSSPSSSSSSLSNSPSKNDAVPKKDMFENHKQSDETQKIINTVNGVFRVSECLKRTVELNLEKKEENVVERLTPLMVISFKSIQKQIKKFEMNANFSNGEVSRKEKNKLSISSNSVLDGSTCKKIDFKLMLKAQVERFEKLFTELTCKNLTSENGKTDNKVSLDFGFIKLEVEAADSDFENLEKQTMKILARLTPTKRNSEKNGAASSQLYSEILNQYNKIALIKSQFSPYLSILTANVELIRPVKTLTQKIETEIDNLQAFNNIIFEKKGILSYPTMQPGKENLLKDNFKQHKENFTTHTKTAITYKKSMQEFIDTKGSVLKEKYFIDLAFGDQEQLTININNFLEANAKIMSVRKESLSDINAAWANVIKAQHDLHSKLVQLKYTINNNQDYLVSERRSAWTTSVIGGELNQNLEAKEDELLAKLEEKLEGLEGLKETT